ncbi:MAG TPA: hypothetical protein VK569_10520, partial [Bacteroidota bacterium]|nr:hypothetical protein [Bacteroidota bacterium]
MKIAYLGFVSNGFDDHFLAHVFSGMNVREFHAGLVREYSKASSWLEDAAGPYLVAVNLETLQAKPLGMFKLDRGGKLYPQIARGQFSGKADTPDDLKERAEKLFS